MLKNKSLWYQPGKFSMPPTGGAYCYLISKIDPESLEAFLRNWTSEQASLDEIFFEVVALDGKTLCSNKKTVAASNIPALDTLRRLSQCGHRRSNRKTNR